MATPRYKVTKDFAPAINGGRGVQWACNRTAQGLHSNGDLYTFAAANKRHARRALRQWVAQQCATPAPAPQWVK